jgi:hypothetical protein
VEVEAVVLQANLQSVANAKGRAVAAETIGFAVQVEDRPELDRLVEYFGQGNRSKFLREAIKVMAVQERAERLRLIQAEMHQELGRVWPAAEANALTRKIVKGKDA